MDPFQRSKVFSRSNLFRPLVWLSLPVLAEHALHILVGMTDTYIANHLIETSGLSAEALDEAYRLNSAAGAAVGSVTYMLWFVGLIVSSIGTGSTAIIARAVGARHRRLANKVCGQSILTAGVSGLGLGLALWFGAPVITSWSNLQDDAGAFFTQYLQLLAFGCPLAVLMFTANASLRGAGDTRTPAVAMMTVDGVNLILSMSLAWGWFGLPVLGFKGIAIGTSVAYIVGGMLQLIVLLMGRGGLKLFWHRLSPDVRTIKRILKIGLPSGGEGLLMWLGNFAVLKVVNGLGNTPATAHNLAIRIESLSYMSGFAIAVAVSTMVGQSLGAKDPIRARKSAVCGYLLGGGIMFLFGVIFITSGELLAGWFTRDPMVISETATCLFYTGFIQAGFAASIIFGSALRGAGDTQWVMWLNLTSILLIRCGGVWLLGLMGTNLSQIWMVLCAELVVRGGLMVGRFAKGQWTHVRV
jgi:putative MATE family efflux protein